MMAAPDRRDFWCLPVYRSLIPMLVATPDQSLSYLQHEKVWMVGDHKIVVKEEQMGKIAELIVRVFREIRFLFNRPYQVAFFKAKDRIERTYADSLKHEKTIRWVVEEKMEKFPEKEKMASEQLQYHQEIIKSAKLALSLLQTESREKITLMEQRQNELIQQKSWWDAFMKGEADHDEAVMHLSDQLSNSIDDLSKEDCLRIYNALIRSLKLCKQELEEFKQYFQNAEQQLNADIQEQSEKKRALVAIMQKIPKSPFKSHYGIPDTLVKGGRDISRRLFDD